MNTDEDDVIKKLDKYGLEIKELASILKVNIGDILNAVEAGESLLEMLQRFQKEYDYKLSYFYRHLLDLEDGLETLDALGIYIDIPDFTLKTGEPAVKLKSGKGPHPFLRTRFRFDEYYGRRKMDYIDYSPEFRRTLDLQEKIEQGHEPTQEDLSRLYTVGVFRFGRDFVESVLAEGGEKEFLDWITDCYSRVNEQMNKWLGKEYKEFQPNPPARLRCEDGHLVQSRGEMLIDNWLYHQEIPHAYFRKVPNVPKTMYSDFYIPVEKTCYIEYWGREDVPRYRERMRRKIALYQEYNINLVSLTNPDIERLDDVLPDELRKYLPEWIFK
ncbi:MAG: hypothetical protein ACE5JP_01295 [Candidatus Bipolaricaulia bacterium]